MNEHTRFEAARLDLNELQTALMMDRAFPSDPDLRPLAHTCVCQECQGHGLTWGGTECAACRGRGTVTESGYAAQLRERDRRGAEPVDFTAAPDVEGGAGLILFALLCVGLGLWGLVEWGKALLLP